MKRWTTRIGVLIGSVLVPTIMLAAATEVDSHASARLHSAAVTQAGSTPRGGTPSGSSAATTTPPSPTPEPTTTTESSPPPPPPPPAPVPALTAEQQAALAEQVRGAVDADIAGAQVGLEVYDRQSGTVVTSLDPGQQFPAMSVVKLFIALDVLAGNNWALPDQATQQRLSQMLSASDDEIADDLWDAGGDGAIITREVQRMGLTGTQPPADPGEWGDTKITAQDMVTTYRYLADTVPAPDRDLLYGAMFHAAKIGADGTDQFFGIPDGLPGTTWAIKQGWGTSGSDAVYDTTGLLGADSRYVVVLLASAPAQDYSALPAALTAGTSRLAGVLSSAAQ